MFENLKISANAMILIEQMRTFSNFDMFPMEVIYDQLYYFPDADPFTVNFEMSGTESTLFLSNIGTPLWIMLTMVILALILALLNKCRQRFTCINKLYEKLNKYLNKDSYMRFFMEVSFDMMFLTTLNLYTIEWLKGYSSVQASNIISIVLLTLTSSVIIYLVVKFFRLPKEGRVEVYIDAFGASLFKGTQVDRREQKWALLMVPALFFVKRIVMVLILIFAKDYLWVQVGLLNFMALSSMMITVWYLPYDSKKANFFEAFNDCTMLVITYHAWCFTDFV